ncbi:hypothetical protein HG537_0G02690 [Torulaspora globosa]|uniref:Uncharacterized protein n=1 Tax=Torulaspora globosa TaxID=48254 RepID=A0A7H9HZJ9_9SACH|nr:hypothetical protein HG537_0G02690 [Torulaspora sp. CBS 2947]
MTDTELGLLLIHPAVTTEPELLAKAVEEAAASGVQIADQFLITKINDKSVTVENEKYDAIYYLTPEENDSIKFPVTLIPVLADALKSNGRLYGLPDTYRLDALINGFTTVSEGKYHWIKSPVPQAVPLKAKSLGGGAAKKLPSFKRASQPVQITQDVEDEYEDDTINTKDKTKFFTNLHTATELIDEEDLVINSNDPTGITMITCGKTKTRRKKACKDCTCGMKEQEQQEIDQVRNNQETIVKFSDQELTEIDFTIEGKKLGGCNSCSLGDAFRCSGCPYLGLPAFKPGQKINIGSILDDI